MRSVAAFEISAVAPAPGVAVIFTKSDVAFFCESITLSKYTSPTKLLFTPIRKASTASLIQKFSRIYQITADAISVYISSLAPESARRRMRMVILFVLI